MKPPSGSVAAAQRTRDYQRYRDDKFIAQFWNLPASERHGLWEKCSAAHPGLWDNLGDRTGAAFKRLCRVVIEAGPDWSAEPSTTITKTRVSKALAMAVGGVVVMYCGLGIYRIIRRHRHRQTFSGVTPEKKKVAKTRRPLILVRLRKLKKIWRRVMGRAPTPPAPSPASSSAPPLDLTPPEVIFDFGQS
ncbi:MAG: hypothetical protein LQ341_003200 [Variospora aurantia]|nr:MAG: hypothetical protein LQ341_003200 [Variospora aurantia]